LAAVLLICHDQKLDLGKNFDLLWSVDEYLDGDNVSRDFVVECSGLEHRFDEAFFRRLLCLLGILNLDIRADLTTVVYNSNLQVWAKKFVSEILVNYRQKKF